MFRNNVITDNSIYCLALILPDMRCVRGNVGEVGVVHTKDVI